MADERWAWVSLAQVPGDHRECAAVPRPPRRRCGRPTSSRSPAALLAADVGEETAAERLAGLDWRRAARRAGRVSRSAAAPDWCSSRTPTTRPLLRPIDLPPPFLLVRGELAPGRRAGGGRSSGRAAGQPVRPPGGRAARRRPGRPRGDGGERPGPRRRHRRPSWGASTPAAGRWRSWALAWTSCIPPRTAPGAARWPGQAPWSPSSRWERPPCRITSRPGTASSRASPSAPWSSRRPSGAARSSRLAWPESSGREVYAVPGNVSSAGSQGTNSLIQDGAKLVQGWEDVVAEWPRIWRGASRRCQPRGPPASGTPPSPAARERRRSSPCWGTSRSPSTPWWSGAGSRRARCRPSLIALELPGLVRRIAGQRYVRS